MNLVIDIGNTHTKLALFDKDELKQIIEEKDIPSAIAGNKIERAIISRSGADETIDALLKEKNIPVTLLSYELKLPIRILYKTPDTLGADRIAGSVGANVYFPNQNVLKIDFGTCVTYDFINERNEYLGGAISPGMRMRFKALNTYTARLPLIETTDKNTFDLTGFDTSSSILSGVVNGIKEEVQGIINEYNSRFGSLKVTITGGEAHFFAPLLKSEIFARPYLVLEGLNTILNYNA